MVFISIVHLPCGDCFNLFPTTFSKIQGCYKSGVKSFPVIDDPLFVETETVSDSPSKYYLPKKHK